MPSYFFHLLFELYPDPEVPAAVPGGYQRPSYLPPPGTNIFRTLLASPKPRSGARRHHPTRSVDRDGNIAVSVSGDKDKDKDAQSKSSSRLDPTRLDPTLAVRGWESPQSQRLSVSSTNLSLTSSGSQRSSSGAEAHDWRYARVSIESIDMIPVKTQDGQAGNGRSGNTISDGIGAGPAGLGAKGRYVPSETTDTDVGWGIVHLYRDAEEMPGLHDGDASRRGLHGDRCSTRSSKNAELQTFKEEECTTLCVLAVPSYLTPSDFLGFVGEKTRDEVTHFRMIRSAKVNRYMVLMKFRSAKKAREWRKEWNGKAFNSMEAENCHVVFIKSVEFRTPSQVSDPASFPDMTNDPFTPATSRRDVVPSVSGSLTSTPQSSAVASTLTSKPLAPPTPSLIELPTCPVCLERMDETTGLLTILCQHVFHCACLQKWKGSGCPVCRYTQEDLGKRSLGLGEDLPESECSVCRSDANLWMCLICGNTGCGRYDGAHAYAHYEQTSHCYAMDLVTQRVWDYGGDGYVHRIVQNKSDGKFVDLSVPHDGSAEMTVADGAEDYVPREKLDNIGMEYTHLLTSQLDSQRLYFEEKLERAADKASEATAAAEKASAVALKATQQLGQLQDAHDQLAKEVVPGLERDKARAERRADKFEGMARKLEKEWREEKAMNGSLMERIDYMNRELQQLKDADVDLREQIRDLTFFISSQEKLRDHSNDVREGTVSVPDPPVPKKKGKGRK